MNSAEAISLPGLVEEVREAEKTEVRHGCFVLPTRYILHQHDYAAAGGHAYIEVLEIENCPDNRCGTVINWYGNGLRCFLEWESLEVAMEAFKRYVCGVELEKRLRACPGMIRFVEWSPRRPWFYAKGDEDLDGDWVVEAPTKKEEE